MVEGNLQVEGEVIHIIVNRCYNFSPLLQHLTSTHTDKQVENTVQEKIFPEGRSFR